MKCTCLECTNFRESISDLDKECDRLNKDYLDSLKYGFYGYDSSDIVETSEWQDTYTYLNSIKVVGE